MIPPVPSAGPTRVLVVDDEAGLREPLSDYLVRQGFVVVQAASAAEARELCSSAGTQQARERIRSMRERG